MRKDLFVSVIVAVIVACFVLAVPVNAEEKEIKIGMLYPLSGPISSLGKLSVNGHKFAVDQINAQGGIKSLGGAKIKLVIADTEGNCVQDRHGQQRRGQSLLRNQCAWDCGYADRFAVRGHFHVASHSHDFLFDIRGQYSLHD